MLQKLILIGVAGALGALARYGLSGLVQRGAGDGFPWGTLAVNVVGCFLAGLFWMIAESRLSLSPETRTIVLVGFVGAFTTFATFALETGLLAQDAEWLRAGGNILMQNVFGITALFLGIALGRVI
jgi:fluoride exporter